uniref:Uncharacterized protein n=1 Tax=Anopheles maculatus TaxID=74869 RepID=A0A182SCA6_9DIPT
MSSPNSSHLFTSFWAEHRMDSSPDLSLKLRRGSSDSRESFYMDFAQGIDSDIEDVVTMTSGGAGGVPSPCSLPPASLPEVVTVQPTSTNQTNVILEEDDPLIEEEEEEEEKQMGQEHPAGQDDPLPRPDAVSNLPDECGLYELPPISSFPSPLHTPASLLVPLPALDIDIER